MIREAITHIGGILKTQENICYKNWKCSRPIQPIKLHANCKIFTSHSTHFNIHQFWMFSLISQLEISYNKEQSRSHFSTPFPAEKPCATTPKTAIKPSIYTFACPSKPFLRIYRWILIKVGADLRSWSQKNRRLKDKISGGWALARNSRSVWSLILRSSNCRYD